ncbi:MAG: hypothetical protein HY675_28705 [Chloroflexi bacterium]|nr:hypothetical protein [Chloroflexota bacterium]
MLNGSWTRLMARGGPSLVFLGALAFYLAILPYRIDALQVFPIGVPVPTGDEPYYLELAHSIVYDHDVELTDNYDLREDYLRFYPLPLMSHRSETVAPGHYSKHQVGLAVLIAPAYWIGDQFRLGSITASRLAVGGFMGILSALLVANIYLLAREAGAGIGTALLATAALGTTNPLLSYSFLIFPEIPAALCAIYAFRRARLAGGGSARDLLVGIALGTLPWLNSRFALIALPLVLLYVWRRHLLDRQRWGGLAAFLAPPTLSGGAFLALNYYLYATLVPNVQDHAGLYGPDGALVGLVGSLIDQQWGLLVHAPVYAIGLAGLAALYWRWRRADPPDSQARKDLILLLATAAPYLALVFSYRQWWGEWCPPARYLVAVLPLLAVPMVEALRAGRRAYDRALFVGLLAVSLGISAAFVTVPLLMYNQPTGRSELLIWLGNFVGVDVIRFFPAIVGHNAQSGPLAVAWLAFFVGLMLPTSYVWRRRSGSVG